MKAVVQRVAHARVLVEGTEVGACGRGMLILVGCLKGDGPDEARGLARRIARFRFFPDERGRMNVSALDAGAGCLVVSQFTLAADGRRGRRPSFDRALPPDAAEPLIERFVAELEELGLTCATGRFGAAMQVELLNEGPVTFVLEEPPEPGRPDAPGRL